MMRVRLFAFTTITLLISLNSSAQQPVTGTLVVVVRSEERPIEQAEVTIGNQTAVTNDQGEASFQLSAGEVDVTVQRYGYSPRTTKASVVANITTRVTVEVEAEAVHHEEITVSATRNEMRIEDEPLRVEVLDKEELDEKASMSPGDVAMLLNETSGIRVQVTAPALGAANVRVQGLRGRYTQLLSDGLPLYGGQTGAIGLLQIPPLDLGQVELIKGVASALYGSSALGGVINLVSRRPKETERQLLVNQTSRGGTDVALWLAEPKKEHWSYTLLGSGNFQNTEDINHDGWADLPSYRRAVLRPRFFWEGDSGNSLFITAGAMAENRAGGTIGNATLPDGLPFPEKLRTRRFDTGLVGRFLVGKRVVSVRGSVMTQQQRHQFGNDIEHDKRQTWLGEVSLSGSNARNTWVIGSAVQTDLYRAAELSIFDYTYTAPAVFAQDDYSFGPLLTLSGSARLDVHSKYGAFFDPRLSALIHLPARLTARLSAGTGVFAPTPFTEETEATGLSRLRPLTGLKPERGRSASGDLGWTSSHVELNGTVFASLIRDPVLLHRIAGTGDQGAVVLVNASGPTRTIGSEALARFRKGEFTLTLTHTFTHSTEVDPDEARRDLVALTPKHTVGFVGTWEIEEKGRIGIEGFYTGVQHLEENPYRTQSRPYWLFGFLAERRFGRVRLFVNAENLANVRQTQYDPLVRPQRDIDGRWTVDEWAPLEGRVINGGIRFNF